VDGANAARSVYVSACTRARANQEIFRVRTSLEKEIEVLKAKLTKSEMANKTLKSTLEAKVACPSMPCSLVRTVC